MTITARQADPARQVSPDAVAAVRSLVLGRPRLTWHGPGRKAEAEWLTARTGAQIVCICAELAFSRSSSARVQIGGSVRFGQMRISDSA